MGNLEQNTPSTPTPIPPNDEPNFNLEQLSDDEDVATVSFAKKVGLLIFEVVKVVLISLAIILPIRYFLVQPFYVEGASMEPNFYNKEYLIIDEISYRFNDPVRGEVIILKNPQDRKFYFIKRVVALPGEKVAVLNGRVFINDKQLSETYIKNFSNDDYGPVTLADDEYFVLGDNRSNSSDSRYFGPLKRTDVIGRVWIRGWPLERFNTFNAPIY